MADDPDEVDDEIWRPEYRGPAPVSPPIRSSAAQEPRPEGGSLHERRSSAPAGSRTASDVDPAPLLFESHPESAPMEATGRRPARRTVVGIAVVVAMSVAVGVIVDGRGEEPFDSDSDSASEPVVSPDELVGVVPPAQRYVLPDVVAIEGMPFVGADPKRLPDTLDPIWSQRVEAEEPEDVWVEVIDRRFALVAVGDDRTSPTASSVLRSFDAETGVARWSTELAVSTRSLAFVAANADSIALIADGELIGIDSTTGEETWRFVHPPALFETDVERLAGTKFLAIRATDRTSTLVDLTTGDTVGRLDGPTIATDHLGRWYVRRGVDIVEYDLSDGYQEPTVVAAEVDEPVVAVVSRDVLASGPEGWTASDVSDERIEPDRDLLDGTDDLPTAAAILPMLGTTFVVAGAGAIVGAELDGRTLRSGWQRNGAVTAMYPTERGFLVHAASEGGAAQTIYDGRTGTAVATLAITPGLFDSLVVAGNGILTKKTSVEGSRLAGLDLDGGEIWSIKGATSAAVGDRLIVTTTRLGDGSVRLDAVGELPT